MSVTETLTESNFLERVAELRTQLTGALHLPLDEGYHPARTAWNLIVDQHPIVVIEAADAEDVQKAVRFAASHHLPIAAMNTGHGMPKGADGGVLVKLGRLNSVTIDAEARRAHIGGGALWSDVLGPAEEAGLAPLSGSSPHVGVVGYTLGGGYGLMVRKYGLAVDSVREMRVVTPCGDLVTASATENADLFWALLGGGGAFGIVTEIAIELYPEARVFGGATIYPAERAEELCLAYREWVSDLTEDVTSSFVLINFPPLPFIPEPLRGRAVAMITACVSASVEDPEALVAPIRGFGGEIVDTFMHLGYSASGQICQDPVDPLPALGQGVLLGSLSEENIKAMLGAVGPMSQSPTLQFQLRHLSGAATRGAQGQSSADSRRHAEFLLYAVAIPNPMVPVEAMDAHARGVFAALEDAVICRGPLNFLGEGRVPGGDIRGIYCDETYGRLDAIKKNYDPENRFRFAGIGICQSEEATA